MMWIGDLGQIAPANKEAQFEISEKVYKHVEAMITNPDLKQPFSPFCVSMKEKIAQFLFADVA
jgi:hypothetical protein